MSITFQSTGTKRIIYKAKTFGTGLTVTCYFYSEATPPVKSSLQSFTEIAEGFYYLDYAFANDGTYMAMFYEDAVLTTAGFYTVDTTVHALAATALLDAALESTYSVSGKTDTVGQALYAILALVLQKLEIDYSGNTEKLYKQDGTTPFVIHDLTDAGDVIGRTPQ